MIGSTASRVCVPTLVADAGEAAVQRFLEFFAATLRNMNTRMAYYRGVVRFFAWYGPSPPGRTGHHLAAACGDVY